MSEGQNTRWSLIRDAAAGGDAGREAFVRRYEMIVRAYLASRWRTSRPLLGDIDDATQEVFLACFQENGALGRVDPDRPGGFRAYLYGITKNIARRIETRRARRERQPGSHLDIEQVAADEPALSRAFDRAWAEGILRDAARLHTERAHEMDDDAARRVDLLRLRFQDGLPIREIARRWSQDPTRVHREYARARREFAAALREVVSLDHPGSRAAIDAECARLAQFFRRD